MLLRFLRAAEAQATRQVTRTEVRSILRAGSLPPSLAIPKGRGSNVRVELLSQPTSAFGSPERHLPPLVPCAAAFAPSESAAAA